MAAATSRSRGVRGGGPCLSSPPLFCNVRKMAPAIEVKLADVEKRVLDLPSSSHVRIKQTCTSSWSM
eukprot:11727098-Heterocapsa_arctica.AAC.1